MTTCNGRCNQPLIGTHHHLYVGALTLAMREDREGWSTWMPDGTLIWRRKPDAIQALKADVRHLLEGAGR